MNNHYKSILLEIAGRGLIASLFFILGFYLLTGAGGNMLNVYAIGLFGCAAMLTGSLIIAPSIARLFAEPLGSLFYPDEEFKKVPPLYGIPESHVKKGLYEQAFQEYEAILKTHPQEIKAYIALLEIALIHQKNPAHAQIIYERGIKTLRKKEQRHALLTMYKAYTTQAT